MICIFFRSTKGFRGTAGWHGNAVLSMLIVFSIMTILYSAGIYAWFKKEQAVLAKAPEEGAGDVGDLATELEVLQEEIVSASQGTSDVDLRKTMAVKVNDKDDASSPCDPLSAGKEQAADKSFGVFATPRLQWRLLGSNGCF